MKQELKENDVIIKIKGFDVIVFACDVDRIKKHKWHRIANNNVGPYFAYSTPRPEHTQISLHRFIMNCPIGMQVDHKNNNTLDNRRENLRICSHAENIHNRQKNKNNKSGYKGVCWYKNTSKWLATIAVDKKHIHIGYFSTPQEAHAAYCEAAKKYHKEYMREE